MAKVYTMGELERARKKAQIREWVQDKKDKATNWCYAHKNEILTYGPVVVSGIAAGAKMLSKHTAQAKEQDLKDLYKQRREQHERKKLCSGNGEMDGRGRYQEHLQRQLDIHERGNCRSISCSRKQRD